MKVLVSLLPFLICLSAFAQEYDFKVMMTSGTNKYQMNDNAAWEALKNGTQLSVDDKINIGEEGYVVLIHNNGSFIELKDSGEYSLDKLGVEKDEKDGS